MEVSELISVHPSECASLNSLALSERDDSLLLSLKKNLHTVLLNSMEDGLVLSPAEFGLSPEWAKTSVSYPSLVAPLSTITGVKTYKKPYRNNQFALLPIKQISLKLSDQNVSIHRIDKKPFLVPVLYQFNSNFTEPCYTFCLLVRGHLTLSSVNSNLTTNDILSEFVQVFAEDTEYYLVSNWKFIKSYLKSLTESEFHVETR